MPADERREGGGYKMKPGQKCRSWHYELEEI